MLEQIPHLQVADAYVQLREKVVRLRLTPERGRALAATWRKDLPPEAPLALLLPIDPLANGCLVWSPGQNGPAAITPPNSDGSRPAGCFVAFAPGADEHETLLVEDGFAVTLTQASRTALLAALEGGCPFALPGKGEAFGFALEWVEQDFHNPVDGQVYRALSGWQTFRPEGGPPHPAGRTRLGHIRLLQPGAPGLPVQALSAYILALEAAVVRQMAGSPSARGGLMIQVELPADGQPAFRMASRDAADFGPGAVLQEALGAVPRPPPGAPCRFLLEFEVSPQA